MKNKLWACFLIFLICFCFIFFKYSYDDAKKTAVKDLNEKQMVYAIQARVGINDILDNWTNLLISITKVPAIVNLDEEGKNYISFTYEINKDDITAVTRVDSKGKIIFTAPFNPESIGQDISGQKHIQEVMRSLKPAVSDVFKSIQGFDMVALHVPIIKNGKFHGTLGIGINFRSIAKKHIESIGIGNTGYAWMISRDGTELYSPVPGHTGKSVFENYKEYYSVIAMAEKMVKGKQGIATYSFDQIREQKVKLVKKHAVYAPIHIGQTFWSIVVASTEDEILSSLKHFRNNLILIIGLFFAGGAIFSFFGLKGWFIVHEEQKRKRTEELLNKTKKLLAETGRIGKVGGWEINIDTEKLTWTEELYNIHEVDLSYDPTVEKAVHFYTPDSRPIIEKAVQRAIEHGESYVLELEIITAKGNLRSVHAIGKADLEHHRVYGFFQDITERKRAEEEILRTAQEWQTTFNSANDAIWILDKDNRVLRSNKTAEQFFHRSIGEMIGKNCWEIVHGTEQPISECPSLRARKSLSRETMELQIGESWFQVTLDPILDVAGQYSGAVHIVSDITSRKLDEEKILASLREKDILISEIHHRVKNNLQVMSGLLDLQAKASKNPEVIEGFRDSQDRIRSMALVHEKLHNSKDFSRIDLPGYMKSLAQELFISHNIHPGKIDLTIEIKGDIVLDVSKAIPCALVMNELISNVIKHAFPGDGPGKLQIIIRETESKELEIIVRDNGVGMPKDVDIHQPLSVGLYLVNGLVKNQIHGQIEVKRDNGTEFRITFPL